MSHLPVVHAIRLVDMQCDVGFLCTTASLQTPKAQAEQQENMHILRCLGLCNCEPYCAAVSSVHSPVGVIR